MQSGIVVIDKPLGITSHDVIQRVRRITNERRVGHAGTLDPLASGVLIVLVGRDATKQQDTFMGLPKIYETTVTFGITSETDDAEGPLHESASTEQLNALTQEAVEDALPQFIGTITQLPPAYSAIKVGGKRLYKHARGGTIDTVTIPPRHVTIDSIEILEWKPKTATEKPSVRLRVHCQKGVYIRSLGRDIGAALGVGGTITELRRTAIGEHAVENALTLEQFELSWKKANPGVQSSARDAASR